MTLSRVPSIGIDPAFWIDQEILADVHLARVASDEFFAREDPVAHLPIPTVDLAFIDGMHLAEYALRDYLAVERFTHPASVIVFDDMLPRTVAEAARHRHTGAWTGDVYKAVQALRDHRPDLIVFEVDTFPDRCRGGAAARREPRRRDGGVRRLAGHRTRPGPAGRPRGGAHPIARGQARGAPRQRRLARPAQAACPAARQAAAEPSAPPSPTSRRSRPSA